MVKLFGGLTIAWGIMAAWYWWDNNDLSYVMSQVIAWGFFGLTVYAIQDYGWKSKPKKIRPNVRR